MSRKPKAEYGRIPEDETNGPPLPRVTNAQVAAVADWLADHRNVRRPLTVAAPLLALVCALYFRGKHFPVRRRVAEWLRDNGYAEWTSDRPNSVDKAIQAAIALHEIEVHYEVLDGNSERGASILRHRHLVPNEGLRDAFRDATSTFGRVSYRRTSERGRAKLKKTHVAQHDWTAA